MKQSLPLLRNIKPTTKVRILKSFAKHESNYGHRGASEDYLKEALELAKESNLGDQVLKIEALFKKVSG